MFIMDRKLDSTLHGSLVITFMVVMPRDQVKRVRLLSKWCTQATARAEFESFCEMNPSLQPELLDAEFIHRAHVH
jgi:hypothetical protein